MSMISFEKMMSKCVVVSAAALAISASASAATIDVSGTHDNPNSTIGAGNTANLTGDATFGWETKNTDINVVLNGFTFTGANGGGNNFRLNGTISGNGAIVLRGNGNAYSGQFRDDDLGFGGDSANTYSGLVTLQQGALHLNKSDNVTAITGDLQIMTMGSAADVIWHAHNQISDSSNIIINGGPGVGYLTLNGYTDTVLSLNLAANSIVNTSGYLRIDNGPFLGDDTFEIGVNGLNGNAGILNVTSLIVDGQSLAAGQYNSTNSSFVIGEGYVNVVPEPASIALLGLGGLLMLKRRRK